MARSKQGSTARVIALAREIDAPPPGDPDDVIEVGWTAIELSAERAVVRAPFGLDRGDRFPVRIEPGQDGASWPSVAHVISQRATDDGFEITLGLEAQAAPRAGATGSYVLVGDLDEVNYDLEIDGTLVRRQLDRLILERGAWATVAVLYADRDAATAGWKAPKVALLRFQKVRGAYKKHAALTLGKLAATALATRLGDWGTQLGDDDDE